jgi:hypothetical protein
MVIPPRKQVLTAEVRAMRDAREQTDRLPPARYRRGVRVGVALVMVSTLVAALVGTTASQAKAALPVTFVGDSVLASIAYVPAAEGQLRHGLNVRLDLRVCRRLVQPSCSFQGFTPTTALQAVRGYGRSLGEVLVVNVGYNEAFQGYGGGIDRVMRAALAQGAAGVVWVTLRETRSIYHRTNIAIKTAARRWPQLVVADWNAYSSGKPWFGDDGLHLSSSGASALATFLRPYVWKASAGPKAR